MELLKNCMLCPRKCGINRYEKIGVCGANNKIKVAYYSLHMWEEPPISGKNGSGTIFFSNCNLKCVYCQNKKISLDGYGKYISMKRLKEIMLELQKKKAHNINLVTPTHYVPQIASVLKKIKNKELNIPVVYNTSSYENVDTIKMMNNIVDIYLADLKYYDVILKPVITEKSMNAMADKKYTFLVHPDATKSQVKEAVEKMFAGTKVASVNTMNYDGKTKRRGMTFGKTAKTKKAIVKLTAESADIEIFEGL